MPADHGDYGDDHTGLLQLVQHRQTDAARELVAGGYDVNVRGGYGETAAYIAAKINDFETLRMLADAGADLATGPTAGLTPLFWARDNGNEPMADFITRKLAGFSARPPGPGSRGGSGPAHTPRKPWWRFW